MYLILTVFGIRPGSFPGYGSMSLFSEIKYKLMNKPFVISVELKNGQWKPLKHGIRYGLDKACNIAKQELKNSLAIAAYVADIQGNVIKQFIKP